MSDTIRFYKHQIKPGFHDSMPAGTSCSWEDSDLEQLFYGDNCLGQLWVDGDYVNKYGLLDEYVQRVLKTILIPRRAIEIAPGLYFAINESGQWVLGEADGFVRADTEGYERLDDLVNVEYFEIRHDVYRVLEEAAAGLSDLPGFFEVEATYRRFFALEELYRYNYDPARNREDLCDE